jgi:hypothetical protein
MKLKDLAIEHQYYCSDNNYYDSDAGKTWETMSEFLDEFEDADIDIQDIKEIIKKIEKEYETCPNENNQGDCLNAKDGFEILIKELKKKKKNS